MASSDREKVSKMQLDSLQYLRGIAAMMVVYFHAVVQVVQTAGFEPYPMLGLSGVDIFFVLSGFVMWYTTAGRSTRPLTFLSKRLVRIAPLYWLLTVAASGIAFLIPHLLHSTRFGTEHLIASLLFIPWWNPAAPENSPELFTPVIVPGWTLNMEMMFYVLFAVIIAVPLRFRLAGMGLLLAIVFSIGSSSAEHNPASFYGSSLLVEFLAGMMLAGFVRRFPTFRSPLSYVVLIAAFATLLAVEALRLQPRGLLSGLPALFILGAAISVERSGLLPRWKLLGLLGDASYSIYLTHVFVIAGTRVALGLMGWTIDQQTGYAFVPFSFVVSGVVGVAVHVYVETRLNGMANGLVHRRPKQFNLKGA